MKIDNVIAPGFQSAGRTFRDWQKASNSDGKRDGSKRLSLYCCLLLACRRTQETYDFLKNGWSEVTQDVLPAFQISSGLKERHGGQLENVSKQVYEPSKEQDKAEISRFTRFEQFFTYKMPGGCEGYESLHDVFTRFVPCLNPLAQKHLGETVLLLVGHLPRLYGFKLLESSRS